METTLSSKGQLVLPAEARRKLNIGRGERLSVEIRDGGVFLQSMHQVQSYRPRKHPVSGLTVMVPAKAPPRKVTAEEIARLNAELL
jgi:AbrB family looped-hinge helix DNA binding protein